MTKNGGRIWAHDWENSGGDIHIRDRQSRVFLVLRYISPLATSRSAVRPWMVRWSSASSIEPSNSGHRV